MVTSHLLPSPIFLLCHWGILHPLPLLLVLPQDGLGWEGLYLAPFGKPLGVEDAGGPFRNWMLGMAGITAFPLGAGSWWAGGILSPG